MTARASVRELAAVALCALLAACGAPTFDYRGTQEHTPMLTDDTFITSDGLSLPLRRWLPEGETPLRAVILALHGLNDYSNSYAEAGPWLASQGIAVYAYDQRGFGASPRRGDWAGIDALTGDVTTAATLLRQTYPGHRLILMGESMGGAMAIASLTSQRPPPVDAVILSAPAVWARRAMPWYQRLVLEGMVRIMPQKAFSGQGLDVWPSDNFEMLRGLGQDPLILKKTKVEVLYGLTDLMDRAYGTAPRLELPVLWLYGAHDELVPPEPTLAVARTLSPARQQTFVLYRDGWHMLFRDLQGERVLADIASWSLNPDDSLPSGEAVDPRSVQRLPKRRRRLGRRGGTPGDMADAAPDAAQNRPPRVTVRQEP